MTSGIYGQITRLGDHSVQVQIADKIRIEVARQAIGGYQGQPPVVESQPQ
jgi:preprotein translocase subunit YajC